MNESVQVTVASFVGIVSLGFVLSFFITSVFGFLATNVWPPESFPDDLGNDLGSDLGSSQRRETCQWTEDENGPHETECGHAFEFTYDGVEANGFKYCCFCGGTIIMKLDNDQAQRRAPEARAERKGTEL